MMRKLLPLLGALLVCPVTAGAAFTFSPGHYYTANAGERTVNQHGPDGTLVGTLALSPTEAREVRGIAFGDDGLLYAAVIRESGANAVLALDGQGVVRQTYTLPGSYFGGNTAAGTIAISGRTAYLAAPYNAARFELGDPNSVTRIFPGLDVYGLQPLPGGNFFVATGYNVREMTAAGEVVRTVPVPERFVDVRGLEYDKTSGNLFVTQLSGTGFPYSLLRVDPASGALEKYVSFGYAHDMFVTGAGDLLVGSSVHPPRLYSQDLVLKFEFPGSPRSFVTQYLVPEPGAAGLLLLPSASIVLRRRRRH